MGRNHEQTTEIPFSPTRLAKILKSDHLLCYQECEKMGNSHLVDWNANWHNSVEGNVTKFTRIKEYAPFDPSIPLLGVYLTGTEQSRDGYSLTHCL